jgi:hypothetical protein
MPLRDISIILRKNKVNHEIVSIDNEQQQQQDSNCNSSHPSILIILRSRNTSECSHQASSSENSIS